jgi:hypothetical protein
MSTSIKIQGRIFIAEQITHAVQYPDQILVYPVDYRMVSISGDNAKRMNEALKAAGFVGEGTLINPARISVIEDAGTILKLYLEGADRVVCVNREYEALLFPAQETIHDGRGAETRSTTEEVAPKRKSKRGEG